MTLIVLFYVKHIWSGKSKEIGNEQVVIKIMFSQKTKHCIKCSLYI